MIPFDPHELLALRRSFTESRLPAVTAAGWISQSDLAQQRKALEKARFEVFDLAHRGRYRFSDAPISHTLQEKISAFTRAVSGHHLKSLRHRWLSLEAGDYSLVCDDDAFLGPVDTSPDHSLIEVSLDVSEAASGEAEIVYTHRNQAYFTVPQRPGQIALVMRGDTVRRYDRYLTHRLQRHSVLRLRWVCSNE